MKYWLCGNWRMLIMVKEFNSLEEIQKYYDKEDDTYVFEEDGEPIRLVKFNFDFLVRSNIEAYNINAENIIAHNIEALDINAWNINACNINANNIKARNINAIDIDAWNINAYNIKAGGIITRDISAEDIWGCDIYAKDITAQNIKANDISYYGVCVAYESIKCKSIEGRRANAKHFVLDGELVVEEDEKED